MEEVPTEVLGMGEQQHQQVQVIIWHPNTHGQYWPRGTMAVLWVRQSTFRCSGPLKFLGLKRETNVASHELLGCQRTVPMALRRSSSIPGVFLSAVCHLATARRHKGEKHWEEM